MRIYIILQFKEAFRVDWTSFPNTAYALVLITSEACFKILGQVQRECFKAIFQKETFAVEDLSRMCLDIAKENKIEKIFEDLFILTHDEYLLEVAAQLREAFSLKGDKPNTIAPFRNKVMAKQIISQEKISFPKYLQFERISYQKERNRYVEAIAKRLGFPIFAKPINGFRSQFAKKIHHFSELKTWCHETYERDTGFDFLLEEYIVGILYNCICVVQDKQIVHIGVMQYVFPCFDFIDFAKPLAGIFLPLGNDVFQQVAEFGCKVLALLGCPENGVCHLELFRKKEGSLCFLEAAARPPGGIISDIYYHFSSIHVEAIHYRLQMGLKTEIVPFYNNYHAWIWYPKPIATIASFVIPTVSCECLFQPLVKRGEQLQGPSYLGDRVAAIIISHQDFKIISEELNALCHQVPYKIIQPSSRKSFFFNQYMLFGSLLGCCMGIYAGVGRKQKFSIIVSSITAGFGLAKTIQMISSMYIQNKILRTENAKLEESLDVLMREKAEVHFQKKEIKQTLTCLQRSYRLEKWNTTKADPVYSENNEAQLFRKSRKYFQKC